MTQDNIRILRVIEFSGPRDLVEEQLVRSLHGEKRIQNRDGRTLTIKVATLGVVAEILDSPESSSTESEPADA